MIAARAGSPLAERAGAHGIACSLFRFEKAPFATPLRLARIISSWRPAILHAQTSDAHTHLWLARAAVAHAPPLIVSRRVAFRIAPTPFSLLKYRTGVAHYTPISGAAAQTLTGVGVTAARITVIPSGIDTESFSRKRTCTARSRWGFSPEDFVVGVVAAFEREKGLGILLDAAAELRARGERPQFVLIGEGSASEVLADHARRAGISDHVRFERAGDPLAETLGSFDLFVLPSLEEGLSTALLAAMASGLPVVASRTGGIPDAVLPGCGMLVPPGDARSLANAIHSLMHDAALRARLGSAAKARSGDFDIGITAEKMLDLYRRVASAIPGSGAPVSGRAS
jgi:glycosyltransferase involved in cell wall biosynthesis